MIKINHSSFLSAQNDTNDSINTDIDLTFDQNQSKVFKFLLLYFYRLFHLYQLLINLI